MIAVRSPFAPLLLAAVVLATAPSAASAQSAEEKEARGFLGSVAATVYSAAWPSATYKEWGINSIQPVQGGLDVDVRFNGVSGLSGGELWLDLIFQFRQGSLHDIRIRNHNALLFPPFTTTKTLAALAVEMAKDYSASSSPPPQPAAPPATAATAAAAVCIVNLDATRTINFQYRWGPDAEWTTSSVQAGYNRWFSWNYPNPEERVSPVFQVRIDVDASDVTRWSTYDLERYAADLPVSCEGARQYNLRVADGLIHLTSAN